MFTVCIKKLRKMSVLFQCSFINLVDITTLEKHHHKQLVITQEKLNEHCIHMFNCLSLPSMSTNNHKTQNLFRQTALKYTGCFNIKFRVQTRQSRVDHIDAKYVAVTFKYLNGIYSSIQRACSICMYG